jgi:hypothetical protein
MSVQMDHFGLPAGRYDARIEAVDEMVRDADSVLRVRATVLRNGREIASFCQIPGGARRLAARLQVAHYGPTEDFVAAIGRLVGETVTAHVRPGPLGPSVSLYRGEPQDDEDDAQVLAGEVLERLPDSEPQHSDRTVAAQGAHHQLITGLRHANRGLALAAQACWQLRQSDGWVALGYESVSQYLAAPEVAMARSVFYELADIWQEYVERGGQPEERLCQPSKLGVPLRALKAGEVSAREALDDAQSLGLSDLRKKYRGEKDANSGGDETDQVSGRPDFPFACRACGVIIESETDVVADGVVYGGHRWPGGWTSGQVLAAVAAAEREINPGKSEAA